MPKISVIMPVYKNAKFLRDAIESISAQSFKDFEFIIANEYGSDDGSEEIIKEYAASDKRIRFVQNSTYLGICGTLNNMIDISSGEYVARMDADDISGKKRFEVQLKYFDRYPNIGCFGIRHGVIGSNGWRVQYHSDPNIVKAQTLLFVPLRHPTIMCRVDCLKKYSIRYDESIGGVEDMALYQQMAKHFALSNIQDVSLFTYRVHADMTSKVKLERDRLLRTGNLLHCIKDMLNLDVNEFDAGVLTFVRGAGEYDGDDEVKALIRLEELLDIIIEQNRGIKAYEDYAVRYLAYHRWNKELERIGLKYNNQIPAILMDIFRNGKFYKLGT